MFPSIYYPYFEVCFPKFWILHDEPLGKFYIPTPKENSTPSDSLLFHVKQDDYFSTLASILRFYEEAIKSKNISEETRDLELKTIRGVMNDLLCLNKNFSIVPKNGKRG